MDCHLVFNAYFDEHILSQQKTIRNADGLGNSVKFLQTYFL